MEDKVHGAFVSEKVSKVRWKPEDLVESDIFLTGSWDNEVSNITSLARLK
jgi:nuclear pore complex protein Nup43